ncbi:MAG: trypsin-like peptidase domain-containing protein [Planctomycetes bacterium]|nr:trypsin-like peptidase domain-containing protein [Planctomycetota bacterium]
MKRYLLPAGLALAGWFGVHETRNLREELDSLASAPRADPAEVAALEKKLGEVGHELDDAKGRIERDQAKVELARRVLALEARVFDADCRIDDQVTRLSTWESQWTDLEPSIDSRLTELKVGLEERWRSLDEIATRTARVADEDRERLERIDDRMIAERDRARMWDELVGPVVQLAGDTTVGSGVLLESRRAGDDDEWRTHLMTAWHVVRDIYGTPDRTDEPVPVKMYLRNGETRHETAHLIAHDAGLDVALLVLDTHERVPCGARLATRQRLADVRIFDGVYAVGCPLGNDPIPTRGEIAATEHVVEGTTYWMVSAPTYIGNSGGGIFDSDTHELLAIFSKIYTHGSLRSTIVPHMGLATPLIAVYDWLENEGLADAPTATSADRVESSLKTASAKH